MNASTIPVVKAALYERLKARLAPLGVDVTYGLPPYDPAPEWLWLGPTVDAEQHAANLGASKRDESYPLDAALSVLRLLGDQQAANERAFALLDEVDAELRVDPSLGGLVRSAVFGETLNLEERADGRRCEARIEFSIAVKARV